MHIGDHLLRGGPVVILRRGFAHDFKGSEHTLANTLEFCDLYEALLVLGIDRFLEELDGLGEVISNLFALLLSIVDSRQVEEVVGENLRGKFFDYCHGRGHHIGHSGALVDIYDISGENRVLNVGARLVWKHSIILLF